MAAMEVPAAIFEDAYAYIFVICPRQVLFAKRVPEKRKVKAPVAVSPEQIVH